MIKLWEDGDVFVIGKRESRAEGWWHKRISGIYWRLIKKFIFKDFPSDGYDFCLIDRKIVEKINLINEKNTSIFILIYWLGFKPKYISINRELRTFGKSQWTLLKKINITIDTLIGFTYLPSRLITLSSLTTSLISFIYFIYILINWKITGTAPPGWMTVVGLLLLLGTIILFALGIISEYLLRILDESRKRPSYIIERIITNNK